MIAGTSRRKLPRDVGRSIQPAFEQLQLPWLCPRLHLRAQSPARPILQHRATATITSRRPAAPVRSQSSPVATPPHARQERNYAYAASTEHGASRPDDFYIPLINQDTGLKTSWGSPSALPTFSPHEPLILEDSTLLASTTDQDERYSGVYGNPEELHRNLEACLIVGLHERAAATMRRLNQLYNPDNLELLRAHNFFIGHMIGQYNTSGDEKLVKYIQKWYHVDMINQGVQPDAATYALMVQLVLCDQDPNRAARGIRKYVAAAHSAGLKDLVVAELRSVVKPREFRQIIEVVPDLKAAFGDEANFEAEMQAPQPVQSKVVQEEAQDGIQLVWDNLVPKVAPVDLKGEGLRSLQKSLRVLTSNSVTSKDAQIAGTTFNHLRQQKLEDDAQIAALERWKTEAELARTRGAVAGTLQSPSVGAHMWEWHKSLVKLIKEDMDAFPNAGEVHTSVHQTSYAPYLRFISLDRLAVLSIVGTLNAFAMAVDDENNLVSVSRVTRAIGGLVENESAKEWAKARRRNRFVLNAEAKGENTAVFAGTAQAPGAASSRKLAARRQVVSSSLDAPEWSAATKIRVGAALLSLLTKAATISTNDTGSAAEKLQPRPVFKHELTYRRGKRLGVVRCDPDVMRHLRKEPHVGILTKHLPMLIQPKPWSGYLRGTYLNDRNSVVRTTNDAFQSKAYLKLAIENGDMKQALAGLDVLGRVPWRVNRQVFDVMLAAWNTGEEFANFPALDPVVEHPEPVGPDATIVEQAAFRKAKRDAQNKVTGLHSERAYMNFQLEVARAFLAEEFYLPHNMDFRGRAYPIPPYLNQMGADHCRGLLVFGKGKALGVQGLDWLKVHLANVYGYDKASLSERKAFTEENLEHIFDSANNPINGDGWWRKAEDSWQCLATCFELRDALNSPDPTKFVSHLPVHQDGTCNGLQHYAALGGDEAGAKQVNLEPGDRPSDIYTAVADLVREYTAADAAEGLELAKMLQGKINRKIVKPTVMTNVYGVTFQGAREQVKARLRELYPDDFEGDHAVRWTASTYIARHIFRALGSIFNGAAAIQQWLGVCAAKICESLTPEQMNLLEQLVEEKHAANGKPSKSAKSRSKSKMDAITEHSQFKSSVIWTTPLRMPVVQPYRAALTTRIVTSLQSIAIAKQDASEKVLKRKQLQAFPPNFIHSLDATHMLLSALKCDELGLSFAAVHDSFWTHAADVDTMGSVLRDAFVRMHSEDIIGRLSAEFHARYKDNMSCITVDSKSPLGQKITRLRKAKGFLIRTEGSDKITKVLEERQRLKLLASADPELRRQGGEMITPASLYADMKDQSELLDPEDLSTEAEAAEVVEASAIEDESFVTEEVNDIELSDAAVPTDTPTVDSEKGLRNMKGNDFLQATMSAEALQYTKDLAQRFPPKRGGKRKAGKKLWLWLPLTFPAVPQKGGWSVSRLKQSKYFFS